MILQRCYPILPQTLQLRLDQLQQTLSFRLELPVFLVLRGLRFRVVYLVVVLQQLVAPLGEFRAVVERLRIELFDVATGGAAVAYHGYYVDLWVKVEISMLLKQTMVKMQLNVYYYYQKLHVSNV